MKAVNPPPKANDGHGQSEAQVPAIAQVLLHLTRSRRQDSLSIVHKISVVDAFGKPFLRKVVPETSLILFTVHEGREIERVAFAAGIQAVVSKDHASELIPHAQALLSD